MIEGIISFLVWACVIALIAVVVIYVLRDVIGLPIPPKVITLLWCIAALIALLYLFRILGPSLHLPAMHGMTACEGYGVCNNEVKLP